MQTRILKDALQLLVSAEEPGTLVEPGDVWGGRFVWGTCRRGMEETLKEEGTDDREWKPKA